MGQHQIRRTAAQRKRRSARVSAKGAAAKTSDRAMGPSGPPRWWHQGAAAAAGLRLDRMLIFAPQSAGGVQQGQFASGVAEGQGLLKSSVVAVAPP